MPENKSLGEIAYEGYFTTQNPNYEKCGVVTPYNEISYGERENWDDAAQAVRKAVIEECIQAIENDFHWILPMFADEQANSVSDDAAESVRDQIVQFVRSIANEGKDNV